MKKTSHPKHQLPCRDYTNCRCEDNPKTIQKHIFIELTNRCNFNCDFCVHKLSKRKTGFMNLNFLERILNELKGIKPIEFVMFSALGEPTLHPRFREACLLVKKYGYHLIITTNGSVLNEGMKKLPIDELYISLQTPTKEAFKFRRTQNLGFDAYLKSISNFIKDVPYYTSVYLFNENKLLFPNYKGFFNPSDIRSKKSIEKVMKRINPKFRVEDLAKGQARMSDHATLITRNLYSWSNTIVPRDLRIVEASSIQSASCPYYKHHLNILLNGDVTFCCMDYDAEMSLGNLKKETLKKIYSRKKRNANLAQFPFCRRCRGELVPA